MKIESSWSSLVYDGSQKKIGEFTNKQSSVRPLMITPIAPSSMRAYVEENGRHVGIEFDYAFSDETKTQRFKNGLVKYGSHTGVIFTIEAISVDSVFSNNGSVVRVVKKLIESYERCSDSRNFWIKDNVKLTRIAIDDGFEKHWKILQSAKNEW